MFHRYGSVSYRSCTTGRHQDQPVVLGDYYPQHWAGMASRPALYAVRHRRLQRLQFPEPHRCQRRRRQPQAAPLARHARSQILVLPGFRAPLYRLPRPLRPVQRRRHEVPEIPRRHPLRRLGCGRRPELRLSVGSRQALGVGSVRRCRLYLYAEPAATNRAITGGIGSGLRKPRYHSSITSADL